MAEFVSVNDGERLSIIDNFIESNIIEVTSGFPGPPGKDGLPGPQGARGPRGKPGASSRTNEIIKLTGATTNASSYILNASESSLYLPNQSAVSFYAAISAYNITDDTAAAFNIQGAVKRNASGNMSIVGDVLDTTNVTVFSWTDTGMSDATVNVSVDNASGSILFVVMGLNSKNLVWTGTVFINKI